MKSFLLLIAAAGSIYSRAIIGGSVIGPSVWETHASVYVPFDAVPNVGDSWTGYDVDRIDTTYTVVVSGGTGNAYLAFDATAAGTPYEMTIGEGGLLTSQAHVVMPVAVSSPPAWPQGSLRASGFYIEAAVIRSAFREWL